MVRMYQVVPWYLVPGTMVWYLCERKKERETFSFFVSFSVQSVVSSFFFGI